MFQPCLFKNKSVVIYEVQEKFPSYTKPLLAPAQGQGWFDSELCTGEEGKVRASSCRGFFSSPVLAAGKTPRPPPGSSRSSPASLDLGTRARTGRGAGNVLEMLQLQELPTAECHSLFHSPKLGLVLLWHRPHPHPARRGKPMGNTLGVPRERCPSWSGSALAPGSLSGCPQQPQHGAAAGHGPVSFSYQNSEEQGSALSPLICSAAAARLPAVPHPAEGEGSRSF